MRAVRRFFGRLAAWAGTESNEERLRAEIEGHIALQTADNVRAGLSPAEAKRQAVLKFGPVEATKEDCRDARGIAFIDNLSRDVRYALRRLRSAPAFTLTTVLTLALGIGATTAIFTLVHAVILKSLPVAKPGDLYRLGRESRCCIYGGYDQDKEFSIVSDDLYEYLRDNTKGFAELAAFQAGSGFGLGVQRAGVVEPLQLCLGKFVSGNYFAMFGIGAFAGRTLSPNDDRPGATPVAMMSYRLWHEKYGAAPSVIGGVFNLKGSPFTVIGITPPGFFGDTLAASPPDFYLPLSTEPLLQGESSLLRAPDGAFLDLIGRIRPGAQVESIQAQMRLELKQWLLAHWGEMEAGARADLPRQTLFLSHGGAGITSMREQYERWLQILMAASGFVLLIVCANVANLMLVRGVERRQQTSLSIALGARASRMVRQALTESVLLSLAGGVTGVAVAFAGTRLILHYTFSTMPGFGDVPISASPSMPVLLFALAVSLLAGLAFGIAPAWMAVKADPIEALRGVNRSTNRSGTGSRRALVIFQAALSLALLSVSGLLTLALRHLENQNFGFEQNGRTIVNIGPKLAGYQTEKLDLLYTGVHDALSAIPGVSSVALCFYSPLSGLNWAHHVFVAGRPAPAPGQSTSSGFDRVTGGYFETIGNPIVEGRSISERDTANSPHVAVVNQAFVRKFFPHEDPIGKYFGHSDIGASHLYEIVGVAKDAIYVMGDPGQPPGSFFFVPEAQYDMFPKADDTQEDLRTHFLSDIVIAMKSGARLSLSEVRRALASVDPNLPVMAMGSLHEQVEGQFSQQQLIARLTSFFGILSLVLASIGLYGVTAFNAGRRINEIGVRMALGADRPHLIALILRGAFGLIAVGLLIGLPLSLAFGRLLGHQLYGMNPYNPVLLLTAIAALGLSALIAALIPAFRASAISPLQALRTE